MSRRKSTFGLRCAQIVGVGVLLYGTAWVVHAAAAWLIGRL